MAAAIFQPIDCRDIRMIQRRQNLRFALEAAHALGVCRQLCRQELQRYLAVAASASCSPADFAHPTFADFGGNAVMGDSAWGDHAGDPITSLL